MLRLFSNVLNLKRISDLYELFREYIEDTNKRTPNQLDKMWNKLKNITEFKELIAREKLEALKGNKTYIVAALGGLATAAKTLGYIDENTWQSIMGFLAAIGGVTMAAKINRNTLISQSANSKVSALMNERIQLGQAVIPNPANLTGGAYKPQQGIPPITPGYKK